MRKGDGIYARVFHGACKFAFQRFFQWDFVDVKKDAAFYLHAVELVRVRGSGLVVKIFAGSKKSANIFCAAKKTLVSVVLALGRFVRKICLAFSVFAEAFMAELDYQVRHVKKGVGMKRHENN